VSGTGRVGWADAGLPYCSSSDLTRDGHDQRGRAVRACGACGHDATTESASLVAGPRFPVRRYLQRGEPVLSVDTKKKELVGPYKNGGREWQPTGQPERVKTHDFLDQELGKAIPYGVYDVRRNQGFVSVGTGLFAAISTNWRGKPLTSHADIVSLIGATTSRTGLTVRAELDRRRYPKGVKVSDEEMAALRLEPHPFHGDWNYTLRPGPPARRTSA
jgi:hypothetical protein